MNLKNKLSSITKGYAQILILVLKAVFVAAVIVLAGFVVIYPLWYSALHYQKEYSIVTGILVILILLLIIAKKLKAGIEGVKQTGKSIVRFFGNKILKAFGILVSLSILYLTFLMFHYNNYLLSLLGIVVFLLITGALMFG